MRKVRPDEVPVFGSVWQWAGGGVPLLALGLKVIPGWGPRRPRRVLVSLRLQPKPTLDENMIWSSDGQALDEWRCLEDSPILEEAP